MLSLLGLDPGNYAASALHQPGRVFPETNCYVDIWIELLHSLGINPASAMAFACTVDFEGDQWTFFKPPLEEMERLYGLDVHEMQLYRPVVDHVVEQLRAGRSIIIEADAFYMPDRAATSYRKAHVKSSIAIEAIDPERERLRYFHGPGFYELAAASAEAKGQKAFILSLVFAGGEDLQIVRAGIEDGELTVFEGEELGTGRVDLCSHLEVGAILLEVDAAVLSGRLLDDALVEVPLKIGFG